MKIYLAGPYSDKDPSVRASRFDALNRKAGELMKKGFHVFSPISHTHPIAVCCDLPLGYDFWEEYDRTFIEWCDEVWVLRLDGYAQSKGVDREIGEARRQGKRVRFIE